MKQARNLTTESTEYFGFESGFFSIALKTVSSVLSVYSVVILFFLN